MALAAVLVCLGALTPLRGAGTAQPQEAADGVAALLSRLEQVALAGDADAYLALLTPDADPGPARSIAAATFGACGNTRVAVRERDRLPLPGAAPGDGYRLAVDFFVECGSHGRIVTWGLDVRRAAAADPAAAGAWQIASQQALNGIDGLEHLAIDRTVQYAADGVTVSSEDLQLRMRRGAVFVARAASGVTAAVLIGDGDMVFAPAPATERGQMRIFAGDEVLRTRFDAALVRVPPAAAADHFQLDRMVSQPVDARLLAQAESVFQEEAAKSFVIDLADLSSGQWWILPQPGDFLAEVRTRKRGTLTYARSWNQPEDVSLFDRRRRLQIAIYASAEKLRARGPSYTEGDGRDYDVARYDIDTVFAPDQLWLEGSTRMRITTRTEGLSALTVRLANALEVHSVLSAQHGRLLALRVQNQNTVIVNLPKAMARGTTIDLFVSYGGRLEPQPADRESLQFRQVPTRNQDDFTVITPEASYLYSNQSYWYPQSPDVNYARATIRVRVPADYGCVASGMPATGSPLTMGVAGEKGSSNAQRIFRFTADRPARYFACVISRFTHADTEQIAIDPVGEAPAAPPQAVPAGDQGVGSPSCGTLDLSAETTRRFRDRGDKLLGDAAAMARFYAALAGDCPYPSFTLALVEHDLPGGHSPAYFAVLNQVPTGPSRSWRNDPAAFSGFPEYFLAHELAHQWWGQAVGAKNYHEAWISEGFAQYFAALYAERARGPAAYRAIIRHLRRWTMDESAQGPISLGVRLGHIRGDGRVYRAIVYNKGALVLHMLRQLVGDEPFFRGLRRFYQDNRFRKAGTAEVRQAFEAETGRPLERFFSRWIDSPDLPQLTVTTTVEAGAGGGTLVIAVAQGPEVFDIPVPVTLLFEDGTSAEVIVPTTDRTAELRVPLARPLRRAVVTSAELPATIRSGGQVP